MTDTPERDVVERLRSGPASDDICDEAADTITSLRAQLREAVDAAREAQGRAKFFEQEFQEGAAIVRVEERAKAFEEAAEMADAAAERSARAHEELRRRRLIGSLEVGDAPALSALAKAIRARA